MSLNKGLSAEQGLALQFGMNDVVYISDTTEYTAPTGRFIAFMVSAVDGTTLESFTAATNTGISLTRQEGSANKLASSTVGERKTFVQTEFIPIACTKVKLGSGAVYAILGGSI